MQPPLKSLMESALARTVVHHGMHSSPDGSGSFSNVQSIPHSDSTKSSSRHAIEDDERESRPVGGGKGNTARASRTPSVSRSRKTPSIKRMFGRPRSSGGSPRDKRDVATADEELEARIREMEGDGKGSKSNRLRMSI